MDTYLKALCRDNVTQNWDVVVTYDENSINDLLLKSYNEPNTGKISPQIVGVVQIKLKTLQASLPQSSHPSTLRIGTTSNTLNFTLSTLGLLSFSSETLRTNQHVI